MAPYYVINYTNNLHNIKKRTIISTNEPSSSSSSSPGAQKSLIQKKKMAKKKGDGGLLDLETHFAFYGAYHSNQVNILIHTLFVWPILFSTLMLLHYAPPMFDVGHGLVINVGFFSTLSYTLFYLLLNRKAGSLGALLCFAAGLALVCSPISLVTPLLGRWTVISLCRNILEECRALSSVLVLSLNNLLEC